MRFSRFMLTAFLVFLPNFLLAEFLDDLGAASKLDFGSIVNSVNWSPDGKDVAISGQAGSIGKVAIYGWDTSISSTIDLGHGAKLDFGSDARSVNWSPDGKDIAIGGINGTTNVIVYGWDSSISSTIDFGAGARLDFGNAANSVNWSPDGEKLAMGGLTGAVGKVAVYRWNNLTNSFVDLGAGAKLDFGSLGGQAYSVNWSPDGKYLAIGGVNGTTDVAVYKWDESTNSLVDLGAGAKLDFGAAAISVNWSPDGKYLAIGGVNGTTDVAVYKWDKTTNSFIDLGDIAKLDFGSAANSVNWSPDGKYLAIGGGNLAVIYQWNNLTNSFVDLGAGAKSNLFSNTLAVNWSPDQLYLAVGGQIPFHGKVAVYLTYDEYLMSLISQNTSDINFIESRKIIYKNRLP